MEAGVSRGTVTAQRVDSVARVLGDATLGTPDEKPPRRCLKKSPRLPGVLGQPGATALRLPELGDVDQMMKYLDNGRAADQPRAELLLGKLYYEGKWVPADAKAAEAHFESRGP